MIGLNSRQFGYFSDLLIMANKYQLESMGHEIILELQKRRNRHFLDDLPKFPEV